MDEPPIPQFVQVPFRAFTIEPPATGGRPARRGFEFQDWYIAFVLAGFAAGKEDFACARVEAAEDLDAILRVGGNWAERYCQIKSKKEGGGAWTLTLLEDEGVLTRFFSHYRKFLSLGLGENRRIELVLAVEGELSQQLIELRDKGVSAAAARTEVFAFLCTNELTSGHSAYAPARLALRNWFRTAGLQLLEGSSDPWTHGDFEGLSTIILRQTGGSPKRLREELRATAKEVGSMVDGFLQTLRFESRMALLEEATLARLLESADLSPTEAKKARASLMTSIARESLLSEPTNIDRMVLRSWLGVPDRPVLQQKPPALPEMVERLGSVEELSGLLKADHFVLLYGLSKIGKSQLASALIDHDGKTQNYFWFTFSGEDGDQERLIQQLSLWYGERTSIWQPLDDTLKGGLHPGRSSSDSVRPLRRGSTWSWMTARRLRTRTSFLTCMTWSVRIGLTHVSF